MTCLNKWMIGACVATLSSVAIADGAAPGSSEQMMLANLGPAPLPIHVPAPPAPVSVAVVPPVPVTVYPFGRAGEDIAARGERVDATRFADDSALLYTRIEAVNGVIAAHDNHLADWIGSPNETTATQTTQHYLFIGPSSSPTLSFVQWNNADDKLGSDPKRGLALKTDAWTVSATARIPLLGQRAIGATVYVKRRF